MAFIEDFDNRDYLKLQPNFSSLFYRTNARQDTYLERRMFQDVSDIRASEKLSITNHIVTACFAELKTVLNLHKSFQMSSVSKFLPSVDTFSFTLVRQSLNW